MDGKKTIARILGSGRRLRDLDEPELVRILTDAQRFASESVSRLGTKAIPASTDRPASTEP